jgi:hypothetical protein
MGTIESHTPGQMARAMGTMTHRWRDDVGVVRDIGTDQVATIAIAMAIDAGHHAVAGGLGVAEPVEREDEEGGGDGRTRRR